MARNIIISPSEQLANASVTPISSENGIDVYRVHFTFKEKTNPSKVTLLWSEDMVDIRSWWSPQFQSSPLVRQWFGPSCNASRFAAGAPVISTIGNEDKNHLTVAVSDVVTPINMYFYVDDLEQKENIYFKVEFFTQLCPAMETYTADIRVDSRNIPFYESIMSVSPWWVTYGHIIPPCSAADEEPLYSSWYHSVCRPQISIKVSESPEAQNKLVEYYVNYWSQHKDILLHGTFKAAHPEMNYSRISSENDDLRITVLYAENDYSFDGKDADVFNAGNNSYLLLDNSTENILTVKVLDCTGTAVDSVCVPANAIVRIPVPVSGMMQIRKS